MLVDEEIEGLQENTPDTFEVHRADLDDMSGLLALQDTITAASRHARHIEQLSAVDHVVVFTTGDAHTLRLDLKTETALVFPKCGSHTGLHARRCDLTSVVKCMGLIALGRWSWCT